MWLSPTIGLFSFGHHTGVPLDVCGSSCEGDGDGIQLCDGLPKESAVGTFPRVLLVVATPLISHLHAFTVVYVLTVVTKVSLGGGGGGVRNGFQCSSAFAQQSLQRWCFAARNSEVTWRR